MTTEHHRQSPPILVTGASTGIGRKITERLAGDGYFVYAGARNERDLRALAVIDNVQALRLDVTNTKDIEAAVGVVRDSGRGLFGLVNNAGVATLGPVVDGDDDEFDLLMAVNVYGPYRITKAFAPMIIANKGRIVMIGSVSGFLAEGNVAPYCMSKHAIEALTDSLALEMAPFGVEVSVIEPGTYKTELVDAFINRVGWSPLLPSLAHCEGPDDVVTAVSLALFEHRPKRRYMVVSSQEQARRVLEKQISRLAQLNEGHAYTYERGTVIQMLEDALEGARPRTPDTRR